MSGLSGLPGIRTRIQEARATPRSYFKTERRDLFDPLAAAVEAVLDLADEWEALAARQHDWADDRRDRADAYGHAADALRAVVVAPFEETP